MTRAGPQCVRRCPRLHVGKRQPSDSTIHDHSTCRASGMRTANNRSTIVGYTPTPHHRERRPCNPNQPTRRHPPCPRHAGSTAGPSTRRFRVRQRIPGNHAPSWRLTTGRNLTSFAGMTDRRIGSDELVSSDTETTVVINWLTTRMPREHTQSIQSQVTTAAPSFMALGATSMVRFAEFA